MFALQVFDMYIDRVANEATVGGKEGEIQREPSKPKVLVIPTDEELSIAQQTIKVLDTPSPQKLEPPIAF